MASNSEKPSAIDAAWELITRQRILLTEDDIDAYLFPGGAVEDSMDIELPLRQNFVLEDYDFSPQVLNPQQKSESPASHVDGELFSLSLCDGPKADIERIEKAEAMLDVAQAECDVSQAQLAIQTQMRKDEEAQLDLSVVQCDGGERYVLYPDLNEQSSSVISRTEWEPESTSLEEQILAFVANMNLLMRNHERLVDLRVEELEEQNEEDGELSPIFSLPDEIILRIFSYIPLEELCRIVSPVCRRFRLLSHDPSIWTEIVVNSNSSMDPHWLCYLIHRARLLKSLSIRNPSHIRAESLNVFTNFCPLLREIDFGFCTITASMLYTLVSRCPLIRRANFEGSENVDMAWITILCKLQHLEDINLSYCSSIQDQVILHLAENTKKLRGVSIDGNSFLTDLSVIQLVNRHHTTLEKYSIDGWENTDDCIKSLSRCQRLTKFTISFSNKITRLSVPALQKLTGLKKLQIRKNDELTGPDLIQMFEPPSMRNLTYLDLSECVKLDNPVVKTFCNRCPKLRSLILHWCWNICENGVTTIVDNLSDLEYLDLLGLDQICGSSFSRLPLKLSRLKFLNLTQCNRIDDELICQVVERMPDLQAINFYQEDFRVTMGARRAPR